MTMLYPITVRCGLCGTETEFDEILSSHSVGSSDLDTRNPAMRWGIIQTLVQRCPGCGYCASDVSVANTDAQAVINDVEYREQLNDPAYPELANSFLCKAILDRQFKCFVEATWALIRAAWVCDDADHLEQAKVCRQKAADMLMLAEVHNQQVAERDGVSDAILVDLLRRSEQVGQAREVIAARRGKVADDLIKHILDYQTELLDKNDFSRHTVAEARSRFERTGSEVAAKGRLNAIATARKEPEDVGSSGIGLGSTAALPRFQAPHKSSDQAKSESGASMREDTANKPKGAAEAPSSPRPLLGLKDHRRSLLFYFITVVVAVVGIGLGREGSPIESPLSFLFAIPGVLAAVLGFLMTIIAVWELAPVLIERSPAPARPLLAVVIVAIWASIPICIYYLNHDTPFNFYRLLNFFEFRGLLVAKLFVVGIIASLFGHKYVTPRINRIQPYILIPVVSMFIGFWLSPESDPAAEATGLTVGLVYYIGVLVAASIGYFLGQVMRNYKNAQGQ